MVNTAEREIARNNAIVGTMHSAIGLAVSGSSDRDRAYQDVLDELGLSSGAINSLSGERPAPYEPLQREYDALGHLAGMAQLVLQSGERFSPFDRAEILMRLAESSSIGVVACICATIDRSSGQSARLIAPHTVTRKNARKTILNAVDEQMARSARAKDFYGQNQGEIIKEVLIGEWYGDKMVASAIGVVTVGAVSALALISRRFIKA